MALQTLEPKTHLSSQSPKLSQVPLSPPTPPKTTHHRNIKFPTYLLLFLSTRLVHAAVGDKCGATPQRGYCHDLNKGACKGTISHGDCPWDGNNVKCYQQITRCYRDLQAMFCSWPETCGAVSTQLTGALFTLSPGITFIGSGRWRDEQDSALVRITSSAGSMIIFSGLSRGMASIGGWRRGELS